MWEPLGLVALGPTASSATFVIPLAGSANNINYQLAAAAASVAPQLLL